MFTFLQVSGNNNSLVAVVGVIVILLLFIVVWWKIFAKAGYSGILGLLMLVPIINIILLLVLAFGEWPVHREMRLLRERAHQAPVANVYYPPQVQ